MMLGKLPFSGRPTIWIIVGQGPTALAVSAGGGCLDIFTLIYPFFPLSPSLWESAQYRLKYCLKGPNPKSTNQPTTSSVTSYVSCLNRWARQNFPALLKIEYKLFLIGKKRWAKIWQCRSTP